VSAKSESRQNEFRKIGQTLPDQSFRAQSGLPEIQQAVPVTSFDAIASAPKLVQGLAFQRCFTGYLSFEYLIILFNFGHIFRKIIHTENKQLYIGLS